MKKITLQPSLQKRGCKKILSEQQGVILIEALVAVIVFAIGVVGILGLGARAISGQSDAQYRSEAAQYTDNMIQMIALGVDRSSVESLRTSLAGFAHQTKNEGACEFSADDASTNAEVIKWVNAITSSGSGLPGVVNDKARQQIVVTTDAASNLNKVTVTVCWKAPGDVAWRMHSMVGYIN